MTDDSIPQRVNILERESHTLSHRIAVIEDTHKDIPHRITMVEQAVKDMPYIRKELRQQHDLIRKGFTLTNGIMMGAAAVWLVLQAGPQILRLLGTH